LQAVTRRASQCVEHAAEIELHMEPMINNVKALIDAYEEKNEDAERLAVAAMLVTMDKAEKAILELAPARRQADIAAALTASLTLSNSVPVKNDSLTRGCDADDAFDEVIHIIKESAKRMSSDPVRQEAALPQLRSPRPANLNSTTPAPWGSNSQPGSGMPRRSSMLSGFRGSASSLVGTSRRSSKIL